VLIISLVFSQSTDLPFLGAGVGDKPTSAIDVSALVDIVVQIQDVIGGAVDDCKAAGGSPDINIDVTVKIVVELIKVCHTFFCGINFSYRDPRLEHLCHYSGCH